MSVLDLEVLELKNGSHPERERGVCLMEAVAWFANEPHSDHPQCASPVLTRFGIALNDRFSAEYRQKLKVFIPRLVGTRNEALEAARGEYLLNACFHVLIPVGLRSLAERIAAAGDEGLAEKFREHARQFEELPKIKYARDLARAFALALDRDLFLALDRDLFLARARGLDLAVDLDLDLAVDLARALDLAVDLARGLDLAVDPTRVWDAGITVFEGAISLTAPEAA